MTTLASTSRIDEELPQDSALVKQAFFQRKYLLDRMVGCVLLVATAPLTLVLYAIVRLTSPGPGFYRQTRVGLHGETFEIVKLRSMCKNAEKPGQAVWAVKNDSRVTFVGKILRRLHLDELPQLWNVAKGEMSMVGPRPERPEICEKLAKKIDGYYNRVNVKPGVTGLAQVNLPPDETFEDVQRKQILDIDYIEKANMWLDFRLVIATALRVCGLRCGTICKLMCICRKELVAQQLSKSAPAYEMEPRVNAIDMQEQVAV